MTCKIFLSDDGKYIVTKHWGEITGKILLERIQEAHKLGDELGITKHLMDMTEAKNIDSIADTYNFAYKDIGKHPGINMNVVVAVLVNPEDHTHDFAGLVTSNAGQNVTLFTDREAAIKHLLKD